MDENKAESVRKKVTDARELSKWGQVLAAFYIGIFGAVKFVRMNPADIKVTDIIVVAVAIAACFSPTFVSIWVDKYVEFRKSMLGSGK